MKKNTLAVVALALLLVALTASCKRAKPAVVSEVQVTATVTATTPAGGTLIAAASPSPTSEGIPTITRTPSLEAATPTPSTAAETTPTVALTPTPISTLVATPAPTPAPTAVSGEQTHTVQPGENLFRIALHYGMTHRAVAAANGIINPDLIYVGQRLTISTEGTAPAVPTKGRIHVVQPGENLFRIALRYGITVEAMAAANGILNVNLVYPGQELLIP